MCISWCASQVSLRNARCNDKERMRNVSDKVIDKINTHILCSTTFYENRTDYETVGKNMVEPQATNILWRLHMECWITEATNTHSGNRILTVFPRKQWLRNAA